LRDNLGTKVASIQAASTVAIVVAVLTVLVPALAAAQRGERRAVESLLELRQEKVVVQKWDLSCGAAASMKSAAP